MRNNPSTTDILQDSLEFTEGCRVNALAGAEDVLMWMHKVCLMPKLQGQLDLSRVKFCQALDTLGIRLNGKPLTCGPQIWACGRYAFNPDLRASWGSLACCAPSINEMTKLKLLVGAAETFTSEKGEVVSELLIWVFDGLHNGIIFREMLDKELSINFLTGKGKNPTGLAHVHFKKYQLLAHITQVHRDNMAKCSEKTTPAAGGNVLGKLASPALLKEHFTPPHFEPKLSEDWDDEEAEPSEKRGISFHCGDQFTDFRKTLVDPMEIALADILFDLHGSRFDQEILQEAQAHSNHSSNQAQKGLDGLLRSGGTETKTELQKAFLLYLEAYQSKPKYFINFLRS